jgi:hypothetical protein
MPAKRRSTAISRIVGPRGKSLYKIPFPFNARIEKLQVALEPPRLTPEHVSKLKDAERQMNANR